jgi:phosphopantetheinyl transferase
MCIVISHNNPTLGLWYIKEHHTLSYFSNKYYWTHEEEIALQKISHPAKRLQKLAARACFKQLLPQFKECSILNDGEGRPFIMSQNNDLISLSHSDRLAGFIHSNENIVALDIERIDNTRSLKVAKMFMNEEELRQLNKLNDIRYFYLLWCVKECLYKILNYKIDQISFQRQLYTITTGSDFNIYPEGFILVGCKRTDLTYEGIAHYYQWNDYMIAYMEVDPIKIGLWNLKSYSTNLFI